MPRPRSILPGILASLLLAAAAGAGDIGPYLDAARKLLATGQLEPALQYAAAAAQGDPQSREAALLVAQCYKALGKTAEASQWEAHAATLPAGAPAVSAGSAVSSGGSRAQVQAPPGSLVLFDDKLAIGVESVVLGSKTEKPDSKLGKVVVDSEHAYSGTASLKFTLAGDSDTTGEFDFLSAWTLAGLGHPADLRPFQEKGALVFWVRTVQDGLQGTIGFKMAIPAKDKPDKFPRSTVHEANYVFTGPEWQKVIVPLADYPPSGFTWEPVMTPDGKETDEVRRIERFFSWENVHTFSFWVGKTKFPEKVVWMDQIMLVPSYDPAELASLQKVAGAKQRAFFDKSGLVLFDDELLSGNFWFWMKPFSGVVLDETVFKTGKKSAKATMDNTNWSGMGFGVPSMDLSGLHRDGSLKYWIRGGNGGENFTHTLHSQMPHSHINLSSQGPDLKALVDLSTNWVEVKVPLAEFKNEGHYPCNYPSWDHQCGAPFNWADITAVQFELAPTNEPVVWYMDEIRFTPD